MEPSRADFVGLASGSFLPGELPFPFALWYPLAPLALSFAAVCFCGGVADLVMGEAGGGGILVPSVILPKFKSSAGNSNRDLVAGFSL